jgi:glycosyltransferase involved in cell wall biosynthesis/GT2 family glycosyltransferase
VLNSILIGVHVHAEPERLKATLDSLRIHSDSARLILLPDGPDQPTSFALPHIGLPQLPTSEPRGPAACFNRLAASSHADVVVLLESGCVVGPGWLQAILLALEADPRNGLAGPSTNRSWNEQGAFPDQLGTPEAVANTSRGALQKFGSAWRTLEPLHSLADFCYAVRREVIDNIGSSDEAYGLGPCWEMDYNIRAARAGFRGVWACSSYVYRAPFTARRAREEQRRFPASRKLYQDKFCRKRLIGERPDYEPHCRGDACEHFAPAALVQVRLPLPAIEETPIVGLDPVPVPAGQPLVSCVMVTRDRPGFVLQSIRYFLRQDYPNCELIILDDGPGDLSDRIGSDPRIRYVKLPRTMSIGAKRNRGCELARGSLIAQWDDDDWYAPDRISLQVEPLLAGGADITGLQAGVFFDLPRWAFWRCSATLHRRLFVEDVHGGTLVYKRSCWETLAKYPDLSLAEDAAFLRQAMHRGARLKRIQNHASFIYLRHAGNAWSFECGKYLDPSGWYNTPEPELLAEDRAFYVAYLSSGSAATFHEPAPDLPELPLVSCIMPTSDRRALVPQSIRYFLRQDYPRRELIIVDDGVDAIADVIPEDPRISYVRLPERHTIGAKRNLACQRATGKIIAHWDDDDWIADWRLSYQVNALSKAGGKAACGLSSVLYYDPRHDRAWRYTYPERQRRWVAGNTLCYHKDLWQKHPFPQVNEGEDTRFVWSLPESSILPLPNHNFYVATVHDKNSSPKRTQDLCWRSYSAQEIRSIIGPDFVFYEGWPSGQALATA